MRHRLCGRFSQAAVSKSNASLLLQRQPGEGRQGGWEPLKHITSGKPSHVQGRGGTGARQSDQLGHKSSKPNRTWANLASCLVYVQMTSATCAGVAAECDVMISDPELQGHETCLNLSSQVFAFSHAKPTARDRYSLCLSLSVLLSFSRSPRQIFSGKSPGTHDSYTSSIIQSLAGVSN